MKNFKASSHTRSRFLILGTVFAIICLAFLVTLAVTQIRGGDSSYSDDGTVTRTVTVAGLRGEIYDRNGVLLVGNSTSYDLIFEYGAMPDTRREVNKALLSILEALTVTGNGDKMCENLCPLEGTYPNMQYTKALSDKESTLYKGYIRVLERNNLSAEKTTAEKLVSHFTKRYKLSEDIYSNEEITDLIRILYDMERVDFGQYQAYKIASDVNGKIITYIEEAQIDGATFTVSSERVYAYPGVASHILGRVGKITAESYEYYSALGYPMDAVVGTSGCEEAFEEWLRGQDGKLVIKYDKTGHIIEKYYETEPTSGNDVWLTIDINLQLAAEEGLAENVTSLNYANAGAITVMDPNSGSILALASYPTYDLTQFDSKDYYNSLLNDSNSPLYNRALQGVYAPGSTYKLGVALAALEEGTITAGTTHQCNRVYPYLHKPTCLASHGTMHVSEAIRESCNIFFYYVGQEMGIERITEYTSALGLGVPTGIELSERIGVIAGPAYRENNHLSVWNKGDDLSAAIGQSDHGYTPLQLCLYTAGIANGGIRYSAHLLDSVHKFYTGEIIYQREKAIASQVSMRDDTHQLLLESMRDVVTSNSDLTRYFSGLPVSVGGKTGTAQVTGKKDYAIFTGVASLESPELVATCIIEQGVKGTNAAMAVSKVFKAYYASESE